MNRVELAVDGLAFETWVASEADAAELRIHVLEAAASGATIQVELREAIGEDLVSRGHVALRLGRASTVLVRVHPDDRTGGSMGISR